LKNAMPNPSVTETPVMRATRRIMANLDKRREEITRLRLAIQAALA
jgi:hypothetical protein